MKKLIVVLFIVISTSVPAYSLGPMDSLQVPIDEVINILKDPQYQSDVKKEEQREKISSVIRKIFNFAKISQLALGRYRKKFSSQELKDFTDYFSKLLEKTYLNKIQAEYQNEKVNYLKEKIGSGKNSDKALIKTIVTRQNVKIPVDYKMWKHNGAWWVYDIKVEGVSLVKNYRNQFQKILLNKPPAHLIELVKNKVEKKK